MKGIGIAASSKRSKLLTRNKNELYLYNINFLKQHQQIKPFFTTACLAMSYATTPISYHKYYISIAMGMKNYIIFLIFVKKK